MITDLLIIAAGMGSRLKAKGDLKPLVELEGKPLIEHALASAFDAGLQRAVIVTGYNANILTTFLEKLAEERQWQIETVFNPDFELPNGLSVLKAREKLPAQFCLAMCDHYIEPRLYKSLLAKSLNDGETALAVDTWLDNPFVDINDVTRVCIDKEYISEIGKELKDYNAFDTGVFAASSSLFDAIAKRGKLSDDYSISGGMNILAEEQKAIAVDVTRKFWIDVDCPQMHDLASQWLQANPVEI